MANMPPTKQSLLYPSEDFRVGVLLELSRQKTISGGVECGQVNTRDKKPRENNSKNVQTRHNC